MQQPLTLSEVRELEQLRNQIQKLVDEKFCEEIQIDIGYEDKELWLKTLNLALTANEEIQKKWRKLQPNLQNPPIV